MSSIDTLRMHSQYTIPFEGCQVFLQKNGDFSRSNGLLRSVFPVFQNRRRQFSLHNLFHDFSFRLSPAFSPISDNTSAGLLYAFRIQYTLQDSRRCRPYNGYSLHSRQAFPTLSGCYSSDISFRMFRRKYSRHGLQISYP